MKRVGAITYTQIRQIGVGQGMNSEVYLVHDPQLGGEVVAKEIKKSQFLNAAAYFTETNAMFAASHDNVVEVQTACETPDLISLIMPFYPNGSLMDRIRDRPLQLSEVQRVAQGVLAGLAHIHQVGYIHFDLKPSNVLFSKRNQPLVADFGQSRIISPTGVVKVPGMYEPARPPEVISTGVATILADIYHAGLLLYRALNGDPFYWAQIPASSDALERMIKKGKFPDRSRFMPHVPSRLRTLVRKALKVNPADRFQSATAMADALGRVDIALNWVTEPLLLRGFRWTADRVGQCSLIVELQNQGASWGVRTFTQTGSEPRRAKCKSENWKAGLSESDAYAHLEEVFERLLQ